jgi:hypothetical protein
VPTPEVKKRENAYIEDNHTSELLKRLGEKNDHKKETTNTGEQKERRINIIICKLQLFIETEGRRGKQEDNYEHKLKI